MLFGTEGNSHGSNFALKDRNSAEFLVWYIFVVQIGNNKEQVKYMKVVLIIHDD
jgi:hypothetical protein